MGGNPIASSISFNPPPFHEHVYPLERSTRSKKPSRDFFDKIASTMSIAASELLLVDDTLDNMRTTAAASWKVLHWTGERSLAESLGELQRQEKSF
jgi:hypothetical protein